MLRLDLDTTPGGVHAQWRKKGGDSYLSLHRRDGSRIIRIHVPRATEPELAAVARVLTQLLGPRHDPDPTPEATDARDTGDSIGGGEQT